MYKHEDGVVVPNSHNSMASHAQVSNRPARRPAFFCYHCNQNFPSRESLEDHVKQISSRSIGQKRADSTMAADEHQNQGIHVEHHPEEHDEYGPSHDELTQRQREHHQDEIPNPPRAKRQRVMVEPTVEEGEMVGNGQDFSASSIKVESGFFDLSRAEIAKIKTQNEYAAFTVDGKECYHCGDEFTSRSDLIAHPRKCMRMKNANYYGKIIHGDGTLEEINVTQHMNQQSPRNGSHRRLAPDSHEQEQEQGALIIDQNVDENLHEGHEDQYETATKVEQHQEEWQPAVQCPLCNEYFENKAAVKLHRYQCVMDRALPVRKPGQPINTQHKGFCCFHCDRLFPTREELRIHVNEVNSQNLRY